EHAAAKIMLNGRIGLLRRTMPAPRPEAVAKLRAAAPGLDTHVTTPLRRLADRYATEGVPGSSPGNGGARLDPAGAAQAAGRHAPHRPARRCGRARAIDLVEAVLLAGRVVTCSTPWCSRYGRLRLIRIGERSCPG